MLVLTKYNKGENTMGKTNKKDAMSSEDQLMELYDQLATQWAQKVEANKSKV